MYNAEQTVNKATHSFIAVDQGRIVEEQYGYAVRAHPKRMQAEG